MLLQWPPRRNGLLADDDRTCDQVFAAAAGHPAEAGVSSATPGTAGPVRVASHRATSVRDDLVGSSSSAQIDRYLDVTGSLSLALITSHYLLVVVRQLLGLYVGAAATSTECVLQGTGLDTARLGIARCSFMPIPQR